MAGSFLTTDDKFHITCDDGFLVCDPLSDNKICCLSCVDDTSLDVSYYEIKVPCGALNVNIAGVDELGVGGCDDCDPINDDWEVEVSDSTNCTWHTVFEDEPLGTNCSLIDLDITVRLFVCCDDDTDEIVLYAYVFITFGNSGIDKSIELDRQDVVDGECYSFDWSSPNTEVDCDTADVSCDTVATLDCSSAFNCDWDNVTVTITAA